MKQLEKVFSEIDFFKNVVINRIQKLTEGKNNQNFKVDTDKGNFLIKICHNSEVQGINRQIEYLILEKVHRAGLGPKPIAFEPKTNSIVTEFLDLPAWSFEDIRTPTALKSFGESIRKIHELAGIDRKYQIADLLDRYWHSLKNYSEISKLKPFFEITRKKLDAYHPSNDLGFCHNDLCYGHFLKGKTIIFLDWEMAGTNDIYSDLAGFIHFHRLDNEQTKLFLQAYSPTPLNKDKLAAHKDAILLRELLWVISKLQEGQTDYFYTDYRQRCWQAVDRLTINN